MGCQSTSFVTPRGTSSWHLQTGWCRLLASGRLPSEPNQEIHASALQVGERVFVGTQMGQVWALQKNDGGIVWRQDLPRAIAEQPVSIRLADRTLVVVADVTGTLSALAFGTGEVVWTYRLPDPVGGALVTQDSHLYVLSRRGYLASIDGNNGKERWHYERKALLEGPHIRVQASASPLFSRGFLYVGFPDGYMAQIEADSGEEKWLREIVNPNQPIAHIYTPVMLGEQLVVSTHGAGIWGLVPTTGEVRWFVEPREKKKPVFLGQPVVDLVSQQAYVPTSPGGWLCLRQDGTSCGRHVLPGEMSTTPRQTPWGLVWGLGKGWALVEKEHGRTLLLRSVPGGLMETPSVFGHTLYEQSLRDRLCSYDVHSESF